jgi:hypothetical protein
MARIRNVKPEFWTHDDVLHCSRDARLLFIGMWNFCDSNGVHPAKALTLRCEVFPGDEDVTVAMVQGWVAELISAGLVEEFRSGEESGDRAYWFIPGFRRHQLIDPKKERPKHPEPTNHKDLQQKVPDSSGSSPVLAPDSSPTSTRPVHLGIENREIESRNRTLLPIEPDPEPPHVNGCAREHEPEKPRQAKPSKDRPPSEGPGSFREFYAAYPKKVDPGEAEKAFGQALKALVPSRFPTFAEAGQFLTQRATAFARAPAGQQGKFTKGPAPWLRARGYDSDDSAWQLSEGKYGGKNKHAARTGAGFVHAGDDSVL